MVRVEHVIGIYVPHPGLFYGSLPEIPFGKHLGKAGERLNDGIQECGGNLVLTDVLRCLVEGAVKVEPPAIRCSRCELLLSLHAQKDPFAPDVWGIIVREWAQMAFGLALIQINTDHKLRRGFSVLHDGVEVCLPRVEQVFDRRLLAVLDTYCMGNLLGVWPEFGVKAALLDLENANTLKLLLLNAGILMTAMEKQFQAAIERAAHLASSASEPFHPMTRRQR